MTLLAWIPCWLILYFGVLLLSVKYCEDNLGARSGLFGGGLATMLFGFIGYHIVECAENAGYWFDWFGRDWDPPFLYYLLSFGSLLMAVSGIVMVAVDLLKAVNELGEIVSRKDEKPAVYQAEGEDDGKAPPAPRGKIPTWKQIEMQEKQ